MSPGVVDLHQETIKVEKSKNLIDRHTKNVKDDLHDHLVVCTVHGQSQDQFPNHKFR